MADRIDLELPIKVTLTPELLAKAFCEMDDDAQAQFFVHVAAIMHSWGSVPWNMQPYYIGAHLRECACVTADARDLIENIYSAMTYDDDSEAKCAAGLAVEQGRA